MLVELLMRVVVSYMISDASPDMQLEKAWRISELVVREARQEKMEVSLVVAVMSHESGFRNLPVNGTNDRGLMQVHWSKGAPWLKGLTPSDLMDPATNVRAGVQELSWWREHHMESCSGGHPWWAHYKWGYRVKDPKYGRAVGRRIARAERLFF